MMNAAVLVAHRTIELQQRPIPQPGPGEVRVKVGAVGVCGSDVHYYEDGRIGSKEVQYPTLMGHEPAGVIDAVGDGVEMPVGTRVMIEPADPCGHCEFCRSGRQNICPDVQFLGTPPIDGIFCQYRVLSAHCCIPIPDGISLVEAAMLEPLGVGLHAISMAHVQVAETVAIFGAGPIGLVTLLAARAAGASRVYMTDLVPERLTMATKLGADGVFNAADGDVPQWIASLTGGRGVDATFEAVGKQEPVTHACLCARIGGRASLIGIPSDDNLTIPMHDCRRRELTIQHVRRSNGESEHCLDMVARRQLDVRPLATHFFSLDQVAEAFTMVHNYADGVIRAVILPNEDLIENENPDH